MYEPLLRLKKNRKKRSELKKFLNEVAKRRIRGIDTLAARLHSEAFQKIDCLACANCCKTMTPTWKKSEVKRVAARMGISYQEYYKRYLKTDRDGDIMNRKTPCQHLASDNRCMIYDIRPVDCSGFPHTQKRGFNEYVPETHLQNLDYCPATAYIVEKMFDRFSKR